MTNSLALTYRELRSQVGHYMGFDRDPDNWGQNETDDVQRVIDDGLRQFYIPPRLPGEGYSHQWSFLKPWTTLTLEAGKGDYELPPEYMGQEGSIYFINADWTAREIKRINEAGIMQFRQNDLGSTDAEPKYAAISPRRSDGVTQSGYVLMLYPTPDAAYSIRMKILVRPSPLRDDADVPLGGTEHASAIIASCIAMADARENAESRGGNWQNFLERLSASIDLDRRAHSPGNLGYNGDPREASPDRIELFNRSVGGVVTYSKYPLSGGQFIVTEDGEAVLSEE